MNIFRYLERQLTRLKIDLLTQRAFLAGEVPSVDRKRLVKTVSTNYEELEIIFFEYCPLKEGDVLIDVGCGKGRVFSYLLYKGLKNKMIGCEINPAVGDKTKKRLARYKNVEIRSENIFDHFPTEGNIIYLYNPFIEELVVHFMHEILKIADRDPVVIYNNPVYYKVFEIDKFDCQLFEIPVPKYGYSFSFAVIRVRKG